MKLLTFSLALASYEAFRNQLPCSKHLSWKISNKLFENRFGGDNSNNARPKTAISTSSVEKMLEQARRLRTEVNAIEATNATIATAVSTNSFSEFVTTKAIELAAAKKGNREPRAKILYTVLFFILSCTLKQR